MKKITYKSFKEIYKNNIKNDFKIEEIRPLFLIKKAYKNNNYACIIYDENIIDKAYATFAWKDKEGILLLDYFAVKSDMRKSGIGSLFIKELVDNIDAKGILIECDAPETTEDEVEKKIRERRIDFYLKNGAQRTNVIIEVYTVVYHVLWLPITSDISSVNIRNEIIDIYQIMLPWFYKNMVNSIIKTKENNND